MKKIIVFLIIASILLSVVSCTENPQASKKKLCDYSVEFFIDGADATDKLSYLLDGMSLKGYEGTEVDISESIIFNVPSGLVLDEENSVLSGAILSDGSLKLSVYYSLNREELKYDFNLKNQFIDLVVEPMGATKLDGIIADETASDGYAFSATRENASGGMAIDLGEKSIDDYERIFVRVRISGSQTYQMRINGETELCYLDRGAYQVYDIKPFIEGKGIDTINSLDFYSVEEESGSVLVDSIVFVDKEDPSNADPSYLVSRDEFSYYISDFNNQEIMKLVETVGIDAGGNNLPTMSKVSWGFAPSDKAHYNVVMRGIKVQVSAVSGAKYNLPTSFDLTQAKEIVIRFTCDRWHGGYLASYFLFTNGTKTANIINYCKIYYQNGQSISGTPATSKDGTLDGVNYRRCTIVLDVAAFIRATGMKTIDGVIFGSNKATEFDTHYIDEMYYTVNGDGREIPRTDFVTGNVVPGGYYMEDTAHGLQITGTASTFAVKTLETAISGSDIETLTVRYKEYDNSQAIIKFISGDKDIYFNLTKAQATDAGVISKEVDEYGFTIVKLNFAQLPSDSWQKSERETLELTAIGIGSTNSLASPIFDYVSYNE